MSNTELKKVFQKIILVDVLISFLIIISYFFQSEAVSNLNANFENNNSMTFDIILLILIIILVVSYIISLILLYRFNKYGKKLFLINFISGTIISLFLGPSAQEAYLGTLDSLSWSITGAILVFLYFTPISKEFNIKK
jgi:hypothetical protein